MQPADFVSNLPTGLNLEHNGSIGLLRTESFTARSNFLKNNCLRPSPVHPSAITTGNSTVQDFFT